MKNSRTSIVFLGLIIILGAIGGGYSAWVDKIVIHGAINTGYISWKVVDHYGTWVYKDILSDQSIESDTPLMDQNLVLIAYARVIHCNSDNNDVCVMFDNLFPGVCFEAGVLIRYTGTVPGIISGVSYDYNPDNSWIESLVNEGSIKTVIRNKNGDPVGLGYQLHKDDEIYIDFLINIPQEQKFMELSGGFKMIIEVTQWNEYKVELPDEESFDVSGYTLYQFSSSRTYVIPNGTVLEPGGYIVIARNCNKTDFENYWDVNLPSNVVFLTSNNRFPIINGDETYELRDKAGVTLDGLTAQPMIPYHSIQRINTTAMSNSINTWVVLPSSSATPGGGANSTGGNAGLIINEYSDASGKGNWKYEFIELYYDA